MRRPALALVSSVVVAACSAQPPRKAARTRAPLYDNLGTYNFTITTKSPGAQKYFNQGFKISNDFKLRPDLKQRPLGSTASNQPDKPSDPTD